MFTWEILAIQILGLFLRDMVGFECRFGRWCNQKYSNYAGTLNKHVGDNDGVEFQSKKKSGISSSVCVLSTMFLSFSCFHKRLDPGGNNLWDAFNFSQRTTIAWKHLRVGE